MTERPNIRRLRALETSHKSDEPFDPERDVTSEQLTTLREQFDLYAASSTTADKAATLALAIRVLSAKDEPLPISDEQWEKMKWSLDIDRASARPDTDFTDQHRKIARQFALMAARMKMLEPRREFVHTSDIRLLELGRQGALWREAMEYELAIKLCFPSRYHVSPFTRDQAVAGLAAVEQQAPKWWKAHILAASAIRMLYPKDGVEISKEKWKGIHETLQYLWRDKKYEEYAEYATLARILAAKDFDLDENGLQLSAYERPKYAEKENLPHTPEFGETI